MRIIALTILMGLLIMACKERKEKAGALAEAENMILPQASQGTAQLTLGSETFIYDDVDWEKTRVKYDGENLRLTLCQESLPRIRFRFPNIHESLDQQREFKIPDVLRGGKSGGYFNSPITLSFQVYESSGDILPKGVVSFHKGMLSASFEDGRLKVDFEGEGRTALVDEKDYFPIKGTIDVRVK